MIRYGIEWSGELIYEPMSTFMDLNLTNGIFPWVPVHENTDAAVRVSILFKFSFINSSALLF